MSVKLYDSYLQSKTICINPALITFVTKFHRPCLKILNSDIQFPKHLTWDCQRRASENFHLHKHQSPLADQQAEKPSAVPSQPTVPAVAHTASYLPFISFGFHSHANAWKLGDPFFCFPAFPIAPESCMHKIRLFAYVNHSAQNIPSCVSSLQTAACTTPLSQHRTVYSQFIP